MTPFTQCVRKIENAFTKHGQAVMDEFADALDELEANYPVSSERAKVLGELYATLSNRRTELRYLPIERFLIAKINQRQNFLLLEDA